MSIERELALEIVRVTEQAALAAGRWTGKGDKHMVDEVATEAMRKVLNDLAIQGTVVIGEGEMDEAPMLYIGESLGKGGPEVDIAVDPVEGTTVAAKGLPNAVTVIAISEKGGLFHAPDIYMEKLIVPPPAAGKVGLDWPVEANLRAIALSLNRAVEDLVVVVLDRPRHEKLISDIRKAGARVKLIGDGDVIAALAAAMRGTGVHAVMGIGGAPEGVLAAAALRSIGGQMQGRLVFRNDVERRRATNCGITDFDRKYELLDLAHGDVMFAATGVTDGTMLRGVRRFSHGATTHSMVMRSKSGTVRYIEASHNFERKTGFEPLDT